MEKQIKESLARLLDAIARSDGTVVASEMARLDEFLARNRAGLPPQLAHFLERRSYAKALGFLGGETPAAGTCGPRKGARLSPTDEQR